MALRWYTVVVECQDVGAQAAWWRETLGWQTVDEADDEVVIVPAHVSEELVKAAAGAGRPGTRVRPRARGNLY
jgi:Glyoxalase-like domain